MGVHGLWEIVGVTARPVRIEALRNKKLAVDASIWIYQFLKAVRDSEGNQLKNSHIIGFFRRICKLLYFGIKPIFVFDGGVPALKRNTIRKRKEKREGNKESVEQTAQRILSKQLQQYAEGKLGNIDSTKKTKVGLKLSASVTEKPTSELYDVYYDDLVNYSDASQNERLQEEKRNEENESRLFRKQDDYDLPSIKEIKVHRDDNRLTTDYEYDRLTKDIQDDLDDIDLENVDPQSKEFERLPLSTQYIVLSHLRLRSRLRMGYTKVQLQALFPDPMEFSKFQIKMVQKRNFFTQKIMNVTGMDGDDKEEIISRRIASDRNRAYNLKRTSDGFALSISKAEIENSNADTPVVLHGILPSMVPDACELVELDSGPAVDWADADRVKPIERDVLSKAPRDKNTLFIQESDEASMDESDDESVEMEDVTDLAPQNIRKNQNDDDDEMIKQIKYLYDYSEKNNKKGKKIVTKVIVDDEDMDEYHELQLKQIEEEELKVAVEQSKKDYKKMLNDEKLGNNTADLKDEQPIILTSSTLSKTLKLPNFSMKNNLLFGSSNKQSTCDTINEVVADTKFSENKDFPKPDNEPKLKPKPLSLPSWFTNYETTSEIKINESQTLRRMTDDEKAGLLSYGDVKNYFSSEDEIEFVDVSKPKAAEVITLNDDDENTSSTAAEASNTLDIDIRLSEVETPLKENASFIDGKRAFETKNFFFDQKTASKTNLDNLKSIGKINTIVSNPDLLNENLKAPSVTNLKTVLVDKPIEVDDQEYEFSDEEEVNLLLGMEEENKAYENFVTGINGKDHAKKSWGIENEAKLQDQLRKQRRDADEVSTTMIQDVKDLLGRFGIPFITAPMEAEAQCAELKLIGIVDGIITDDSDCFLFGGNRIYKNLFSDKHFVECYNQEDIAEELGLDRGKMIELAVLLGSDYTSGLKGIGKVTAMEILSEFKNLKNFKEWWLSYQNGIIDQKNDTSLRIKLRKKLRNLFLGEDFPNKLIEEAYLHPEVDHDKTPFKWGYPDLDKLRTFLLFNAGWNKEKVDETLLPVIKNMNKPQTSIEEFFPLEMIQRRRKLDMSKRIKDATEKLKQNKKKQRIV